MPVVKLFLLMSTFMFNELLANDILALNPHLKLNTRKLEAAIKSKNIGRIFEVFRQEFTSPSLMRINMGREKMDIKKFEEAMERNDIQAMRRMYWRSFNYMDHNTKQFQDAMEKRDYDTALIAIERGTFHGGWTKGASPLYVSTLHFLRNEKGSEAIFKRILRTPQSSLIYENPSYGNYSGDSPLKLVLRSRSKRSMEALKVIIGILPFRKSYYLREKGRIAVSDYSDDEADNIIKELIELSIDELELGIDELAIGSLLSDAIASKKPKTVKTLIEAGAHISVDDIEDFLNLDIKPTNLICSQDSFSIKPTHIDSNESRLCEIESRETDPSYNLMNGKHFTAKSINCSNRGSFNIERTNNSLITSITSVLSKMIRSSHALSSLKDICEFKDKEIIICDFNNNTKDALCENGFTYISSDNNSDRSINHSGRSYDEKTDMSRPEQTPQEKPASGKGVLP